MFHEAKGDSVQIARMYMDSLLVESRVVGAVTPDTTFRFLGEQFDMPIMTAALSHLDLVSMAEGARRAGACVSIGMGGNEELGNVLATGAKVMKVIKPYADEREILSRIEYAEANGALAVGMDVEHAINKEDDEDSVVAGLAMKLPTKEELKSYVEATSLPFFFKGALSVQDALTAKEIGAAGIILSHHNGLMPWAMPPYALLPDIRKAVGRDLILIADGGIADGFDAFKVLALGADLVSVGRPFMGPYMPGGPEALRDAVNVFTKELKALMARTGARDLFSIDASVLHKAWWLVSGNTEE